MNQSSKKTRKKIRLIQKQIDKIEETLELLAKQLTFGWGCHLVTEKVYQAFKNRRIDCMLYPFGTIRYACEKAAILALTNVTSSDKGKRDEKTVNINYLLCELETAVNTIAKLIEKLGKSTEIDYPPSSSKQGAEALTQHIRNLSKKDILQSISKHKQQIETIKSTLDKAKDQRNKTHAHLDRRLVTNPKAVLSAPLDAKEVGNAFNILFEIIKKCYEYMGHDVPQFDDFEKELLQDFEHLVELVEGLSR